MMHVSGMSTDMSDQSSYIKVAHKAIYRQCCLSKGLWWRRAWRLNVQQRSFETSAQPKITQKKSQRESVHVNHRFSAITFLICDKYYRSVRVCCGVGSSLRVFWSVYERLNWMRACFLLGCFCSCWAGMGTDCHARFSWKSWKIQFDQGCVMSPDRVCVLDCISTWERVVLGHMDLNVHFGSVLCIHIVFWENILLKHKTEKFFHLQEI